MCCFLFKQTTAYEMRISDWSSDVCSSDLDEELLDTFHVPRAMLPEIRSSSEVYGHAQDPLWGVPAAAALGHQQAALVGQGCLSPGQAQCTYGTGNFLLFNTGAAPSHSRHGLLTTRASRPGDEPADATLWGSIPPPGHR